MKKNILQPPVTILKSTGRESKPLILAMNMGRKRKMARAITIAKKEMTPERKPSPLFFFFVVSCSNAIFAE